MREKFDTRGFMVWLKDEFPDCIDNHWNHDLVENLINYGLEHIKNMDQFSSWLSDMLPEVETSEVARFILSETRSPMNNFEKLSSADRAELLGCLIDVVEDWLTEKGLSPDDFPNDDRDGEDDEAIICGKDYDVLSNGFANVLSSERSTVY